MSVRIFSSVSEKTARRLLAIALYEDCSEAQVIRSALKRYIPAKEAEMAAAGFEVGK